MINYGYYDYDTNITKFYDVAFPMTVNMLLTDRCNLRCEFCCLGDLQNPNDESTDMDLSLALSIIDECARNGAVQINYSGGEPLLYDLDKLETILKKGKEKNLIQTITTNGVLLNQYIISRIGKYLDAVNISLHGDEYCHNKITKSDCYKGVIAAIKEVSTKIPTNILFTLSKGNNNPQSINSVINFVRELDINIIFARANEIGKAYDNDISAGIEEVKQLVELVKAYKEVKISIANCIPACVLDEKMYTKACSAGVSFGCICTNGDVKICSESKEVLGTVNSSTTLKEIWNGELIKKYRSLEWMNARCKSCKSFRVCKGGCKAESQDAFGADKLFMEKNNRVLDSIAESYLKLNIRCVKKEIDKLILIKYNMAFYIESAAQEIIDYMIEQRRWKVKDILSVFSNIYGEQEISILLVDMYEKELLKVVGKE